MKCGKVRSKLKEYAEGKIYLSDEKGFMEKHIEKCPICMKELEMWQDVLNKQKKVKQMRSDGNLAERVKKRKEKMERNQPAARKMLSMQKFLSDKMGCLVMQVILLMIIVGIFYIFYTEEKSPLFTILIGISAVSMIFVLIKNLKNNRKK